MHIQEISVSNNQRKKLSQCVSDQNILQVEENGDIIVKVETYLAYKKAQNKSPIEDILDDQTLDVSCEFIVFI